MERLFHLEYNSESDEFYDSQSVSFYGSILCKLLPKMSDLAIEESFYSESDSTTESQDTLMALVYFILKTIRIKTLFSIGFRPKHLQFIIINFPQSSYLPKVRKFNLKTFN